MKTRDELIHLIKAQEMMLSRLIIMIPITRDTAPILNEALSISVKTRETLYEEERD